MIGEGKNEFKCPDGTLCTTHDNICRSPCKKYSQASKCGACEASGNKLFACLSESVFAFCYGKDLPFSGSEGQCKEGYVCDTNNPEICSPVGEVEPSCIPEIENGFDDYSECSGYFTDTTVISTETTENSTETADFTTFTSPQSENDPIDDSLLKICIDNPELKNVSIGESCRE